MGGWHAAITQGKKHDSGVVLIVGGGLPGLRGFSVATIVIGKAFRVIVIDGARLASTK